MKTSTVPIRQIAVHPISGELFALDARGCLWIAGRAVPGEIQWVRLGGIPSEPEEESRDPEPIDVEFTAIPVLRRG